MRKLLRFLASFFAILTILGGLVAWQLSSVTLSSKNWTPYIEFLFAHIVPNSHASIERSSLDWDHKTYTISLLCEDIKIKDELEHTVIAFPKASLKLNVWNLLSGHFVPEEFTADEASFWLMKHKNNIMSLGAVMPAQEEAAVDPVVKDAQPVDVYAFIQNIADDVTSDQLRHNIAIKNLSLKLYHEATRRIWQLKVPELTITHKGRSSTGNANLVVQDGDSETSAIQLTYNYDYDNRYHNVGMSFQDIRLASLSVFAPDLTFLSMIDLPVSGAFLVRSDSKLNVVTTDVKLEGEKGAINAPDLWENPREVKKASFIAYYDRAKGEAKVTEASIDFGVAKLNADLNANISTEFQQYWFKSRKITNRYQLNVSLLGLSVDSFTDIWPKTVTPGARLWISKNMHKGQFDKATATVEGVIDVNDLMNISMDKFGGEISLSGNQIKYMEGMPLVEGVSGTATYDMSSMDVTINTGHTDKISIEPFTLKMTGFDQAVQNIAIPVKIKGTIPDVLTLLDRPRLGYTSKLGLNPKDTKGTVTGTLTLQFPLLSTLKLEDVDVKAEAKIKNFASERLIPNIVVSKANLDLNLTIDGLALAGAANFNNVPMNVNWSTAFNEAETIKAGKPLNKATLTGDFTNAHWAAFYGAGRYIRIDEGVTPVTVTYENKKKGESDIAVTAILNKAAVSIDELAWHKPKEDLVKASFTYEIRDGVPGKFRDVVLTGKNVDVKGEVYLDQMASRIASAKIDPMIIGRSNAILSYDAPDDRSVPSKLTITGKVFDVSGIGSSALNPENGDKDPKQKPQVKSRAKEISIKLDRLLTSDDGFLEGVQMNASRSLKGWDIFSLYGLAQASVPVSAKLVTAKNKTKTLEISSDDFGLAMKGAGFGDRVKGGKINITAHSIAANPYELHGKVDVSSFTVRDWPFLARLFSALSPMGIVDLFTGQASFDGIKGKFAWTDDQILIKDMNASGSVVGLNFKGKIDTNDHQVKVNGTAVPFSLVNDIIGAIPLIGDVITGGKGQGVIAAAFTIEGPLANAKINVNPASLLTPGFLRNIFFSSSSDSSDNKPLPKDAYPKGKRE